MKFASRFVQYPKPVTYLIMFFDLLMILTLGKFIFFLLVASFFGISFYNIPFPVSSIALILASSWCTISIFGLWLDLRSCSQSGLKISDKIIIDRFGRSSEHDLKALRKVLLVDARLLLPICHYAVLKLKDSEIVVEISKEDRDILGKNMSGTGRFEIPFFLSIISMKPA